MARTPLLGFLLSIAGVATAQAAEAPEAFTFDPQARLLRDGRPSWWQVTVSPDGQTAVTAHGTIPGGEWWVWDLQTGTVVATVKEPNRVRFVRFSPDGSLIATANFDNGVRLYDAITRRLIAHGVESGGGHSAGVNALAFSQDGSWLATAGLDRTARVWNVAAVTKRPRPADGNPPVSMGPSTVIEGFSQGVFSVALSPDGRRVATGGQDGGVILFTLPGPREPGPSTVKAETGTRLSGHPRAVECVAWSPDGQRIASGSWDATARLYDPDGKDIATLKGHTRGIMALAFAPDSRTLATVSGDHTAPVSGEVRWWDVADGRERGLIGKHPDMAVGVAYMPGRPTLVSVGRDRALRIWDLETRTETRTLRAAGDAAEGNRAVHALAYSPDATRLALAGEGGGITLWEVKAGRPLGRLAGHTDTVHSLAWSPDGKRLASVSGDHTAILWDPAQQKPAHTLKHPGPVYAVAFSPDGNRIATGGFDKVVRLWDPNTGKEVDRREGHTASVRCLAFRPDGRELASGGSDNVIRGWGMEDQTVREYRAHTRAVRSLGYISDRRLASAGDDGRVLVWDLADGEVRQSFGPYPGGVPALAVSPRGTFLLIGLGNGKVHVLDPAEGQTRSVLGMPTDAVAAVAISPQGGEVAAGGFDREVRIWSAIKSPAAAAVTYIHPAGVRAVALSAGGILAATGDPKGDIRLFDADTGEEKAKWPGHAGEVLSLAFSGNGTSLISGGADHKAKVWHASDWSLVKTLDHPGPVHKVVLSGNGKRAATATSDQDVRVFDLANDQVQKLNPEAQVTAIHFLADDTLLTAGGPRAYLWDLAEGRVLDTLDGGEFDRVTAAGSSADGKLIVLAGDPAAGSQRADDVGNCRVLAVSRHHPRVATQRMHDTGVGAVRLTVSPGGRIISLAGGDGSVRVWEWPTLQPIKKFPAHAGATLGMAISNRGEFVVTAGSDGVARRWAAARGEPLLFAARLTDESRQAWFARVSPDGKVLATGGDDGRLRLRDSLPGQYRPFEGDYECAYSTAIAPDAATFATGHQDGSIYVWERTTGKQMKRLAGHSSRVGTLAFSPDGTRLVSGGGNYEQRGAGELRIWDTATWKVIHEITAHADFVFQVAVAPDGKTIAACDRAGTIMLHDLLTGKPSHTLRGHAAAVRSVVFSRDGSRLYSAGLDSRLHWWDVKTGREIDSRALGFRAVDRLRLSPDGKQLAFAFRRANSVGHVALWDLAKHEIIRELPRIDGQVNDLAFSPDGKTLVIGGGLVSSRSHYESGPVGPWMVRLPTPAGNGAARRLAPVSQLVFSDVETGTQLAELPGHRHWIENLQFTPDGKQMVAVSGAGKSGEIRVWETAGIRPRAVLGGVNSGLTCAQFSPDGSRLATGSNDGKVMIWDVSRALTGDEKARIVLQERGGMIRQVAWFPDGSKLASAASDGMVRVWERAGGDPVRSFRADDRSIFGLSVSPDGSLLATAAGDWNKPREGRLRVWKTVDGAEAFRLPDAAAMAWGTAFTPDGKLLACLAADPPLKVYDVASRKEVRSLSAVMAGRGLGLSADGSLTGITDQANGRVKVWETRTWREAYEITAHPGKVVFSIDFAPDRQTILSAGGDGAVVVWKRPGGVWTPPAFVPPAPPPTPGVENPVEP